LPRSARVGSAKNIAKCELHARTEREHFSSSIRDRFGD
jgi:hypothetical protein